MTKRNIEDIKELLNKAECLKKEFGENITINEIITDLKSETQDAKNDIQLKFEDLRDFLISKLIKNLVKRGFIEEIKPLTLKVLDRIDLKDILQRYSDKLSYVGDWSDKESNTAYLFAYDGGGGNAFDYLRQCVKASIDKWGLDKDINEFVKNPKDLSIDNIQCSWLYKTNCDDYDCYNETRSIIKLLERKYYDESMLEYATIDIMYDYTISPTDLDKDNEVQWLNVKRISPAPTEIEFFLLMWKYFSGEK